MLRLLRIRNFAIIDELELEFHSGFNTITGETGAGKSILLNAIGLILGNRANADLIRAGAEEATVEALFDVAGNETLSRKLHAQGIDLGRADNEILLKRTIQSSGKNKIYLNGDLITLGELSELCENLVDLCSQHEHQSLAKPIYQLELIDRYGGLTEKRRAVREIFSALKSCEAELKALGGDSREVAKTEDFLRFQLNEIQEFNPEPGEEERLSIERKGLLNSSQLIESANYVLQLLGDGNSDREDNVRSLLGKASQRVTKSAQLDSALATIAESIDRALVETDEAISLLSSYASEIEIDPSKLDSIENRLVKWSDLKKKYGATAEEILKTRDKIESQLNDFAHRQERIVELEGKYKNLREEFQKNAKELSIKRKNIAKTLRQSIQNELAELMMPGTTFEIEFHELAPDQWGYEGLDKIQFLFCPNPGEELKPVAKIASGGELSRVMLAIRRTIADRGGIGVYLFDEIDAGIGGQTATIVGRKLKSVAQYNQVICITHLPQVASYANAHFSVSKKVLSGRTSSQITLLEGNKRVDELARMLGGLNITEKSRAHAKDLLKQAAQ